ncbi:OmpA/MotB family protein [Sphingomonas sp. LY160]|uniref:OmpA/MotB family protein n=1 Tax=Sphingomonas sp. LY160 TaxID=3095342 RepID=UPI002ADECBA2|nr:OmpA family protein [Sphingomonas sp. LY160]MEA1071741.1 OmpA family protein [Sphingomonas sp. LY160]
MILEEAQELVAEEENYFVSMTDLMVGLVFVFIILLMYFAITFQSVTEELTGANNARSDILEELERTLKSKGVPVQVDLQDGVLRLPDSILFDSGQKQLKPEGEVAITHLSNALADVLPCYSQGIVRKPSCPATEHRIESVYVEGHTDSDRYAQGRNGLQDNWDLSVVRATNTYRALTARRQELQQLCVKKGARCEPILSVSGYGEQRPVPDRSGSIEDRKTRNRRIDLRLIMKTPDAGETRRAIDDRLTRQ